MKQSNLFSTLTRGHDPLLKPLSIVFAIVLMAMSATPTFATVTISPTSRTVVQGGSTSYTVTASGLFEIGATPVNAITWYSNAAGTQNPTTTHPAGITVPSYTYAPCTGSNCVALSTVAMVIINISNTAAVKTYYFRVTRNGQQSEVASLTVNEASAFDVTVDPVGATYMLNATPVPLKATFYYLSTAGQGIIDNSKPIKVQWYWSNTNSNTSRINGLGESTVAYANLIDHTTTFTPPTNAAGVRYYYAVITYTVGGVTKETVTNPARVEVKAPDVIEYAVTVVNGTLAGGSSIGNYEAGETVHITANTAPAGKEFDKWTTTDGVTFANATAASTSFTMPEKAVAVTATYKDAITTPTKYAVTVVNGALVGGSGSYEAGETVVIKANDPAAGREFDRWVCADVTFAGASDMTTTFVMPARAVTITATYREATGNEQLTMNNEQLKAYAENGVLYVSGMPEGATLRVYNLIGTLIYQSVGADLCVCPLPARGVYIVTDGKTTVKVVY
jgi:hypothetical protein